ncbi:MAG TPA: prepilin peptidase [Candidatus Binatia bacterium]|nr:prepilin peptidase [Candidatus Binatia bacterium]
MTTPEAWRAVPFHFWSGVFFVFGCITGSFLNVCIHRMPRAESIVSPPSHCPHCKYSIPWFLNIPLVTWLYLRGKCANCRAPISPRYFLVELLTGILFLCSWLVAGARSPLVALVYCVFVSGLIVATFIDFEHFIIPDEITLGGVAAGFVLSLAVPPLHGVATAKAALQSSFLGIVIGAGVIYGILRLGKILFGREKIELSPGSRIVFTETALVLPDRQILYEDVFYRKSDSIMFEARMVEMVDRCYKSVLIRLTPERLHIGDETLEPEKVPHLEAVADRMTLPREAMGLGDVKFMAAIGAFLGWKATVFSLLVSSMIGALVGIILIVARRKDWSARIPYGPYIALAALGWIFGGNRLLEWWLSGRAFYWMVQ